MTSLSLAIGRPTLTDRIFPRGLVVDLTLVAAGAALTAICAQIAIPLWPVPVTGQTLAVLLVGSSLGALRGSISMLLYAAIGILGLPVFSGAASGLHVILGPTGGYIIGFVFAAALTGWLSQQKWDRKFARAILTFCLGIAVIYAIGLPWLAFTLSLGLDATLTAGLYPFAIGEVIKFVIAASVMTVSWGFLHREDARGNPPTP
ncbi:MAG: biotin transporter BioY [Cryobacterium sp.]|nr:biotin transporter BioY [Cryobacterium sp.]